MTDITLETAVSQPVTAPRTRGPIATMLGVLFRPGATFTALRGAKRRWWAIPALIMLVALAFHGYVFAYASAADQSRMQTAGGGMVEGRPVTGAGGIVVDGPGGMPSQVGVNPLRTGLSIGGQVLGAIFTWLVWAGLLALASTFFGQSGTNFGGFFAMVLWARLPLAIRSIIQALYMVLTGAVIYNQGLSGLVLDSTPSAAPTGPIYGPGPIPIGGGRLGQPAVGTQVLAGVLGRIDVYLVWSLVLTVAGVWAFARLPRRKALLITLAIWVPATAVTLLPTIIGLNGGTRIF
jgi:hypothetical protein